MKNWYQMRRAHSISWFFCKQKRKPKNSTENPFAAGTPWIMSRSHEHDQLFLPVGLLSGSSGKRRKTFVVVRWVEFLPQDSGCFRRWSENKTSFPPDRWCTLAVERPNGLFRGCSGVCVCVCASDHSRSGSEGSCAPVCRWWSYS